MNIFVTDESAKQSAINLDDKRVKHLSKEYLELLAIATHEKTGQWVIPFPLWGQEERTDLSHLINSPVSKWVQKDRANLWWLYSHLWYMFQEHEYRFKEMSPVFHFLDKIKQFVVEITRQPKEFYNASFFKDFPIVDAYRKTLILKWNEQDKKKPIWTNRNAPDWINDKKYE